MPATEGKVTIIFKDLEPGRYAIAAFHDEDGDEKLTTNLLGLPSEPFGFSQNARGSFGPPSFDEAAFEIGSEATQITFSVAK